MSTKQRLKTFEEKFERAYRDATLPSVYRKFISTGAYLPYRRSFIRGLLHYDPTEDVALNLASSLLLKKDALWDESDIDPDDAAEFHPIATLEESPQFLAIKTTDKAAPVFLWHHETGAFHLQFKTFARFLKSLRTPKEARAQRGKTQGTFASIRKDCAPALIRARKHFEAGEMEAAASELDAVLRGRRPIEYDGSNDFEAIGILCDCFNLRGRIFLAQGRLKSARAAFLDAMACGGTPYWEALVDAVVTSFLLQDVDPVIAEVSGIDPAHFDTPLGPIVRRNFTAQQIEQLRTFATSPGVATDQRDVAAEVLRWISGA